VALFRRRNNQTNVPSEIQEYYQTERRERAGVAWLLAIGTLVITILLTAGIFFAGRWAWRQIAGDDEPTNQTAQNENQDQPAEQQPADQPAENNDNNNQPADNNQESEQQPAENNNDQQETSSTNTDQQPAAENNEDETAGTTGGSGGGDTAAEEDSTEVAGANTTVPETGPGDTVAIFFAVSVFGYFIHRVINRATK